MQKLLKKNTILLIENYADNIHYSINDYVSIALDQYYSDKCGKTISDTQLSYVTNSVWVPVRRLILQIIYFVCFISRMLDSNNLIQIIRDTHCFW
jgi:hypothetical protein